MLDATKTVREFAVQVPQATRLFEKLGIDYCCGGGKSLGDACSQANLKLEDVLEQLDSSTKPEQTPLDWNAADLGDLIDHIVIKHHAYVRRELPRIVSLLNKVAGKHGTNHPELARMQDLFGGMAAELNSHLMKEEQILFRYVLECERAIKAGERLRPPMFGTVRNPIHMMELEHDSAGEALKEMRGISNGFSAPEDACMSFRALYQALQEFEADLHEHIHLENNILFPRAIELERCGR